MLLDGGAARRIQDALDNDEEMVVNGEPFSPRLHITMHQVVANQLIADDPPETWPFDRADYAMRLSQLPGDWPPPE